MELESVLFLRGIDMKKILDNIAKGAYPQFKVPQSRKVSIIEKDRTQDESKFYAFDEPVFLERREGKVYRIFTTNNFNYQADKSDIKRQTPPCVYCRQPILDYSRLTPSIITSVNGLEFEGYDPACNEYCAKSHLDNEYRIATGSNKTKLLKADGYLNRLAYLRGVIDEGECLESLLDWRLLKANGGSYPTELFYKDTSKILVRQPGVIVIPVKLSMIESSPGITDPNRKK